MTTDELRCRLAAATRLPLSPDGFYLCSACSGVRFTRTLPGAWQAGAIVAGPDGQPVFSAGDGGGAWADQPAARPGVACDTRGCPLFNYDTPDVDAAVIPGPGVLQTGDQVSVDGAVRAVEGWMLTDDDRVLLRLTGGVAALTHLCGPPPAPGHPRLPGVG